VAAAGLNRISFFGGVSALWDGREVLISGTLCRPPRGSACDKLRPILLAYRSGTTSSVRSGSPTRSSTRPHTSHPVCSAAAGATYHGDATASGDRRPLW
jgi:hypothetical protein